MATTQGIYVTVLGMAILFVALGILMLATMALERLFRPQAVEEAPAKPEEVPSGDKEKVAAMAVAIASLLGEEARPEAVPSPEGGLSSWAFWGRYRQLMRSKELRRGRR
ncbi:MAG: OadG family protein [Chloroflexota bacterium]|nr:OadG family protein [Chloroflexota bacterium]